jgi:hypothetical protein
MSSVFTSRVTRTVPIPHDSPNSVTIRKLAPKHLDASAKAAQIESAEAFHRMGGAALLKQLEGLDFDKVPGASRAALAAPAVADPLLQFDRSVLLVKGVQSWTYDAKVTPDAIEDLDEPTQDFLAREVLKLSRPDLFQTPAEQEAATKNG